MFIFIADDNYAMMLATMMIAFAGFSCKVDASGQWRHKECDAEPFAKAPVRLGRSGGFRTCQPGKGTEVAVASGEPRLTRTAFTNPGEI